MMIDAVRILLFPSLMAFAASSDLLTMTISNRVSLLLAAGFCGLALATGHGCSAKLDFTRLPASRCWLIGFVFYTRGWIGGGDAKLAAATALWFGFDHFYDFVLFASVLGGVLTLLDLEISRVSVAAVFRPL